MAGICADVGLGKYKHQFGGHIVFHEAKAILELRPGRMLLFPSAAITHQNIPIGDGEDRMSATAHISGGIPQHIAQGMQGKDALEEEDPAKFAQLYNSAANAARWEDAVSRFLTLAELKEHWAVRAWNSRLEPNSAIGYRSMPPAPSTILSVLYDSLILPCLHHIVLLPEFISYCDLE